MTDAGAVLAFGWGLYGQVIEGELGITLKLSVYLPILFGIVNYIPLPT